MNIWVKLWRLRGWRRRWYESMCEAGRIMQSWERFGERDE